MRPPSESRSHLLRIAPEGVPIVAGGVAASALVAAFSPRGSVLPLALTAGMALFFRDPVRPLPEDPNAIVAAADGVVTRVDTVDEPRFIGGPALRIATFLSLFDVHINRSPVAGAVRYLDHQPGEFRAAWDAEADVVNERNYIGLETAHGPVMMLQIAGLVARRIVCHLQDGDSVPAGERIGMIKFGSRTDVLMPLAAARPLVVAGMRVKAGISQIGEWV